MKQFFFRLSLSVAVFGMVFVFFINAQAWAETKTKDPAKSVQLKFDDVTVPILDRNPMNLNSIEVMGKQKKKGPLYQKRSNFNTEMQLDLQQLGDIL